jgi:hypothetical protein
MVHIQHMLFGAARSCALWFANVACARFIMRVPESFNCQQAA